ncbi:MAG: hypothetical protein ACI8Y7_000315 [Candidatus Woesearchaeota archaeon]
MKLVNIKGKRANAAPNSGAPFLVVLTILIVFYIIFLPPSERAALLGETADGVTIPTGTTGTGSVDVDLLTEFIFPGPGKLTEQTRDSFIHDISPFVLRGQYEAQILAEKNGFVVERTMFGGKDYTFEFIAEDVSDTKNTVLLIQPTRAHGTLRILHNNKQIFEGDLSDSQVGPIKITDLAALNYITFIVDSPGLAFWKRNVYDFSAVRVQAEIIDRGQLEATQIIELRSEEEQQLNSAKLKFIVDCDPATISKLRVDLNGELVFSKVPDCGIINSASLPQSAITAGRNQITFEAKSGLYSFDQVRVETFLDDDEGVTYFFELDDELFIADFDQNFICGENDGVCPQQCGEDVDPDCCQAEYADAYWCTVPTQLTSDRCVGRVDSFNNDRCPSGYKDSANNVHDDFEGACGDNDDNVCPSGCSKFYDKDCCFESDGEYWCDELPRGGVTNICKDELSTDEQAFCPGGYESDGDGRIRNTYESGADDTDDAVLKEGYKVTIEFDFVDDDDQHEFDLIVNGYRRRVDTRDDSASEDITRYVQDRSNYIQIVPKSDFSLVRTEILVEER